MFLSIRERLEFIRGIDIQAPVSGNVSSFPLGVAEHPRESAWVSGGSSISFVHGIHRQMKADVLNSTLFAQLAANQKYDPQNDSDKWNEYYMGTLEMVGWSVQSFEPVDIGDVSMFGSVDKLLLHLAASYLTGGELALFATMIDSVGQSRNDSARTLFDQWSASLNKANFQVGAVSNSGGNAVFKVGKYALTAEEYIDTVLFFEFGSEDVIFDAGNFTMILNTAIYSKLRRTILDSIGPYIQDNIIEIEM